MTKSKKAKIFIFMCQMYLKHVHSNLTKISMKKNAQTDTFRKKNIILNVSVFRIENKIMPFNFYLNYSIKFLRPHINGHLHSR